MQENLKVVFVSKNEAATNRKHTAYHKAETEAYSEEIFSRAAFDYNEGMLEDRKDLYISYLIDRVNETELDKKGKHPIAF